MSVDTLFVKMHTGDPGSGGTAAAATNATRKTLSLSENMDAQGRLTQDAVIAYSGGEVTATETYAWVSYWTAVTGGTWLGNEDIPNQSATVAVALNIPVGTIVVTSQNALDYALRTEMNARQTMDRVNRGWRGLHRAVLARLQRTRFAKQNPQTI